MDIKKKLNQISGSWYFLFTMLLIYFFIFLFKENLFFSCMKSFYNILLRILPVFIGVFILMAVSSYFMKPEFISKHLQSKGFKKWFFIIIGGILSAGPIYMWYPLLADLNKKGLSMGLVSCFLYNRAIKIPLIPVAILYFGWKYILILTLAMIGASIIQGLVIDQILGHQNR